MMRLARRASLLVAFYMLASAATAYAECAWVLWTETELIAGNDSGLEWRLIVGLPGGDWNTCWKLAHDKATDAERTKVLPFENERRSRADNVVSFHGQKRDGSPYFGTIRYLCVPDTVDPRGPKTK